MLTRFATINYFPCCVCLTILPHGLMAPYNTQAYGPVYPPTWAYGPIYPPTRAYGPTCPPTRAYGYTSCLLQILWYALTLGTVFQAS